MSWADHRIVVGLVAALAWGAGCDRKPPAADTAEPKADEHAEASSAIPSLGAGESPAGQAVVRTGAFVFTSSSGDAGFTVPSQGFGPLLVPGVTVNVLGMQNDRVSVETLISKPQEPFCAGTLNALRAFRLRLFVKKDDLLPIVKTTVRRAFPDGTSATISPGATVSKFGQGGTASTVRALSAEFSLEVEREKIGLFYEPQPSRGRDGHIAEIVPSGDAPMTYDGRPIAEYSFFQEGGPIRVYAQSADGEETLVTVRNACVELVARARSTRVQAVEPRRDTDGDGRPVWGRLVGNQDALPSIHTLPPRFTIEAGAAVLWPDGTPAGAMVKRHTITGRMRNKGGRACFDVPLQAVSDPPTTELCFVPDAVRREPPLAVDARGDGLGTLGGDLSAEQLDALGRLGALSDGPRHGDSKGTPNPRVVLAEPTVKGRLSKERVRRTVRAHLDEVRACYKQGLVRDSALGGKVSVEFTINTTGKVIVSRVGVNTTTDASVGRCIASAVKRWQFSKSSGGVVVIYPFVLSAG